MKKITTIILAVAMAAPVVAMTDEQMIKEEEEHTAKMAAMFAKLSKLEKIEHVIGAQLLLCSSVKDKQVRQESKTIFNIVSKEMNQELITELATDIMMDPEMLPEPITPKSCQKTLDRIMEAAQ